MLSTSDKKIPCIIMTRVVGFFSDVSQFNLGKKEEFRNRVYYKIKDDCHDKSAMYS